MTGGSSDAGALPELAGELASDVARRYRIGVEDARRIILEIWHTDRELLDAAVGEPDASRLKRTRAYKRAARAAKAGVYYSLRKYRQDDGCLDEALAELTSLVTSGASADDPLAGAARERIVRAHVSTNERIGESAAFFDALFSLVPDPVSVIDVGCGVQPLLHPFPGAGRATRRYLALDRDDKVIQIVAAWAALLGGGRMEARRWSLSEGFDGIGATARERFDLALALKLVPVLRRQERSHVELLCRVPANRLLVTGSRQAMVKRRSIERREERSLRAFAEEFRLPVLGELRTQSEFGLLLDLASTRAD